MGRVPSKIKVHSLPLLAFRQKKMLPSAVIVKATIRSAKLERAERPADAFPSAPPANPPPDSNCPTRTLASKSRRATEAASLPLHRSTSVVGEKYISQDRISNRNYPKNRTHRKQTIKPSLTEARIAFLPGLPRAILAKGSQCRIEFLPGSSQDIVCDVTYSKQTTGRFLPGATTACFQSPNRVFNRKPPMRPASPSRLPRTHFAKGAVAPRRTTRGICSAFSNRELDLLERLLNDRKQTTATSSNRELSTIHNSAFRQLQTAPSDPPAVARHLNFKRSLNPKITDAAQRLPFAASFPRVLAHGYLRGSGPAFQQTAFGFDKSNCAQRIPFAANFPRAVAPGSSGGRSLAADRQASAPTKSAARSAYLSRRIFREPSLYGLEPNSNLNIDRRRHALRLPNSSAIMICFNRGRL
jgi:hypothetical protein